MKRKINDSFNIETVGELKELLKSYGDDVKLSVARVKMVKPSMWDISITFSDVKLYAETEEEAEDEVSKAIENSEIFPQSVYEIDSIDKHEPDED